MNPVTPPAVTDASQQTGLVASATATEASPAVVLTGGAAAANGASAVSSTSAAGPNSAASTTSQSVVTQAARLAGTPGLGGTTSAVATQAVTASGPTASPTPLLVIIANVGLVPAPTATRPPAISAVAKPKPTTASGSTVAPTVAPAASDVPAVTDVPAPTSVIVAPPLSGDVAAAELYCVDLINAQRTALGLAPLAADPGLMDIANSRVADMVARGYTGHNDPVTGVALGPALMQAAGYAPVGENWFGTRLGPPGNADVAMRWFMTDAPHYQNILNPRYSGVGIGIAYNGAQWLLIQDFGGK